MPIVGLVDELLLLADIRSESHCSFDPDVASLRWLSGSCFHLDIR